MKKKSTSKSAFFNLRVLIASVLCLFGVFVALFARARSPSQEHRGSNNTVGPTATQDAPGTQTPDVVQMVGPVMLNTDLRNLPYIAPKEEFEERSLTRYPHGTGAHASRIAPPVSMVQRLLKEFWRPTPTMPAPLLTFEGGAAAQFCACAPPDSDGDVGPNHYVEAINSSIQGL